MENKSKTILGISTGTHTIGFALIKDTQLVEWRMKVFNKNWSAVKLEKIILTIQQTINTHDVTVIALKVNHPSRSSEGLEQLISAITELSKSKDISLFTCSILDIKKHCVNDRNTNKGVIVEYVLQKHPELHREYEKELGNKTPYYIKLFEAITIAHMFDKQ